MSWQIDEVEGVILLIGQGRLSDAEMLEAIAGLRNSDRLKPGMPTLSDMTAVDDVAITPTGLAVMLQAMHGTDGRRGNARAAIVVRPGDPVAHLFADLLAELAELNRARPAFQVFEGLAEARTWLGLPAQRRRCGPAGP